MGEKKRLNYRQLDSCDMYRRESFQYLKPKPFVSELVGKLMRTKHLRWVMGQRKMVRSPLLIRNRAREVACSKNKQKLVKAKRDLC